MADGHDFFIRNRIMKFLELPLCMQTLTVEDRLALERFGERLRQLIPVQPAVLLHGDLWLENTLVGTWGEPAVIDPAVYYGWPDVDLGIVRSPEVPEHFHAAYNEINPLLDGWQDRLELVRIKNYLSLIAHFGDQYGTVEQFHALVAKYV
jgi:fructosamine-3-kinase